MRKRVTLKKAKNGEAYPSSLLNRGVWTGWGVDA